MLKRILLLTLSFTLIFMLFACGGGGNTCQTHTDKDSDGKCDTCGENVENSENNNNNNNSGDGIALIKSAI